MEVVMEHCVGQAIDPEDPGEKLKSISNPTASMLKGLPRETILAAQEGTSNASLYGDKDLNFRRVSDFMTRFARHD
jgi:hypothetical protein